MPDPSSQTRRRRPSRDEADPQDTRAARRRAQARYRRRRLLAVLVVLAALIAIPVTVSWAREMTRPSSLPMSIHTIEWLRQNNMAWFVNFAERTYYGWKAPDKGGPQLTALPEVGGVAVEEEAAGATTTAEPGAKKPAKKRKPRYLPPRVEPVIKPALKGEGVWHAVTRKVGGRAPLLVTNFRPSADYPRIVVSAAWINHENTQLALYPGLEEPPSGSPRGPSRVPDSQMHRLLAVFNSGFTREDGGGGFAVNGVTYETFYRDAATVVQNRWGKVNIIAWHGGEKAPKDFMFARQNLALLVEGGKLNPGTSDRLAWGATLGGESQVWRSGIGIDAHGNLLYVAGPQLSIEMLGYALIQAGAVRAMEMDINTFWPTFDYYAKPGAVGGAQLVQTGDHDLGRYVTAQDSRDFFAVLSRDPKGDFRTPFE